MQYAPLWGSSPIYLAGPYNSDQSRADYEKRCQEVYAHESKARVPNVVEVPIPIPPSEFTVGQLALDYMAFAEEYYGIGRTYVHNVRSAIRPLVDLHANTRVEDFGPLALEEVQKSMVRRGWLRKTVNANIGRIRRMFKWGASKQKFGGQVVYNLSTLAPLKIGKTKAPESPRVKPVPWRVARKVLPFVSPVVADMIRIQHLTGMRGDELTRLTIAEIKRSGQVWVFTPKEHKTANLGKEKTIYFGPKAQAILRRYIARAGESWLFKPAESRAYHAERRRKKAAGISTGRPRKVRDRFTTGTYYQAIRHGFRAQAKAAGHGVQPKDRSLEEWLSECDVVYWHPHQLRHTRATETRERYGLEGAQAQLGNTFEATEIYAEKSRKLAAKIARETG